MPEGPLRFGPSPPRDRIREALRRPYAFEPPLRILAEDVLGADSPIDQVAVDAAGRIVLVLVGETGEDGALLTRGLAQRGWVAPRLRDWLQLGPRLEISASAPVVARLLCPAFSPETRAAAEAIGSDVVELFACRAVHDGGDSAVVLLEPLSAPASPANPPRPDPHTPAAPPEGDEPAESASAPAASSRPTGRFRSGLREEDLGLSGEEIAEFD